MQRIVLAIAALAMGLGVAQADGPHEGPRPFTWTGFYAGAVGSYVWADQEFPGIPGHIPSPVPVGKVSGPPRMELDGGMLGGQIGAQYQMGWLVVGVEGDYSRGNLSQSVRDGNYIVQTGEIEWAGTLRGRLGIAMGNWLPYVTAGYMWAGASYSQSCPEKAAAPFGHCNKADKYSVTKDATHTGFVYGGGLEWAVSRHFSVKAEGLWFKLDEEVYDMGNAPLTGVPIGKKPIEYEGAMFRLGGSYHF